MTPSRVRLDAEAGPLPLSRLMAFQEDHAAARDAIFQKTDWAAIERALDRPAQLTRSRAETRAAYLKRPDLGRRLANDAKIAKTDPDLAIVIADGLSPPAIGRHAAPVVNALSALVPAAGKAPLFFAEQGRVAIGDEIGAMSGARLVLILIGERPGLTISDSLGAYLTWRPRPDLRDSARNCVSNIHSNGGLSHDAAAARLAWLISAAEERGLTGVGLKDNSVATQLIASEQG